MMTDKESYTLQLSILHDSYKIVNSNLNVLTEKVNNISIRGKSNSSYTTAEFNSNFDTRLGGKTTDDISEGSTNLYYKDTSVSNLLSGGTLSDIDITGRYTGANITIGTFISSSSAGDLSIGGANISMQAEDDGNVNIGSPRGEVICSGTKLITAETMNLEVGNDLKVGRAIELATGYGNTGDFLVSQGSGSAAIWSNTLTLSNYALLSGATFTGAVTLEANLNFDRLNNDTANIRFTSSTQNIGVHSPFIRVGDIEPTGRHGFDFKFRDWTLNAGATNYEEFTLFRAYGNTSGNGQFQVFGATYSAQGWNTSDDRFKHGEYNITNGLETIRNLVPQTYKKTIKMLDENNDGTNIGIEGEDWYWESGLIAQEIEKIPTLSKYVKELDNRKYVSYNNIHIHTISAVKELDTIVQQQAQLISSLEAIVQKQAQLISSLEARLSALESN